MSNPQLKGIDESTFELQLDEPTKEDIKSLTERCLNEGIPPENLIVPEAGKHRPALIKLVEDQIINAHLDSKRKPETAGNSNKPPTFEGIEKRRTGLSIEEQVIADVKGLATRCIRDRVTPENMVVSETGECREILIRKVRKEVIEMLCKVNNKIEMLANRCLAEGKAPQLLATEEHSEMDDVTIKLIEEKIISMLLDRNRPPKKRDSQNPPDFEGHEKRRTGLSIEEQVIEDVNGLALRCIMERIVPDDLQVSETGECRNILIRKVKEKVVRLIVGQSGLRPKAEPQ